MRGRGGRERERERERDRQTDRQTDRYGESLDHLLSKPWRGRWINVMLGLEIHGPATAYSCVAYPDITKHSIRPLSARQTCKHA